MLDDASIPASILYEETRERYLSLLSPLFFPCDPFGHDIIRFFSSLLRVSGIEDKGWDPYAESRSILEDLNSLSQLPLSTDRFPDQLTIWRLGLLLYNHIVEMSAPYEVLANLLRFRLKEGYSPNPFFRYLNAGQKKRAAKFGLGPRQKIAIITELSERADIAVGTMLGEFVRWDLRNSVAHSDFILTEDSLRARGTTVGSSFVIPIEEIDKLLTSAKAFISAFFVLEEGARRTWGRCAGRAIPYNSLYKGLMEVLADEEGCMNGFKVHWPNGEESFYRRTPSGIDMVNCFLSLKKETVELFVGMYARQPDVFSPLVEHGEQPQYTLVEGNLKVPHWDAEAARAKQQPLPEFSLTLRDPS